jgi:hypothetical protein
MKSIFVQIRSKMKLKPLFITLIIYLKLLTPITIIPKMKPLHTVERKKSQLSRADFSDPLDLACITSNQICLGSLLYTTPLQNHEQIVRWHRHWHILLQ